MNLKYKFVFSGNLLDFMITQLQTRIFDFLNEKGKTPVFYIGIFILTLSFLSINLTSYPLWYDEIFSVYHAQLSYKNIINVSEWDVNPPLYLLALGTWRKAFGVSEFSVRFFSVFFMSLSAVSIYIFSAKYHTINNI